MNSVMGGVMEIAMALIGVAILALLVNRASDASKLISTSASSFNGLLQTVTLQNGMGNMGINY